MAESSLESNMALVSKYDVEKDRLSKLLFQASMLVGNPPPESQDISLEQQLSARLKQLKTNDGQEEEKQKEEENDPQYGFVSECLRLLTEIQMTMLSVIVEGEGQVSTDRDLLGVRDLRLLHTLLQVIVSWGIYPCFSPGVGVPLSRRVKSGYTNHELLGQNTSSDEKASLPPLESTHRLMDISMKLANLIIKSEEVPASKGYTTAASIITSRHLPDIYAALLQLAYAPLSAYAPPKTLDQTIPHTKVPANPANVSPAVAAVASSKTTPGISRQEKDKSARVFMWLFERSDAYRAMESLMLLLGTSPLHPVPAWLRGICGRFLSRIILRPNGVSIVLDFTVGDVDQVQFAQLEKISKLILSVPQQMPSVESYYAVIAPQLLVLLEGTVRHSQQKSPRAQAITFVIGRMIIKHTDLAKKYIVDKTVGSLLTYWNQTEYGKPDVLENGVDAQVVMTEDDLRTVLYTLHCVMVGGEPSPVVIQSFLDGLIPMLYHLYEFSTRSKSNLREVVLDLLTTYFRITTTREAIGDFKRILLDKTDLSNSRVAYFGPGPTGGVVLRLRRFPKEASSNQLSIDPKVMVEFLQRIDSPDLCGDFFVFLLSEYSAMQSVSQDTDPKIILMILHLIMGMLDTLGPEILKNPTQIVAFASNVVTEHADRISKPKNSSKSAQSSGFPDFSNIVSHEDREAIEDMHDETYTAKDDFESLLLAIHLMRAVIHENDELSPQAVQLLESGLGPLRILEKYGGDDVQESVHEVILAVTSYLSAQHLLGPNKSGSQDRQDSKIKYREAMKALQDDLLPVRAHGIGMLKEMVLSRDPLVASGSGLDNVLDLFVRLVQDEDSFIYLNAVKGLSALTDVHGNEIIAKLGQIYSDESQKLENRLRVGEALLQTVQRCGDALGKYALTLIRPLETVLARRGVDDNLRVSALSILSMACQTCPVALTGQMWELTDWVLNILEIEKAPEIRRAAIVLIVSLFRGMKSQTLYEYPAQNLRRTYRTLRYAESSDPDELTRYQARVALSDLDVIMRGELFRK